MRKIWKLNVGIGMGEKIQISFLMRLVVSLGFIEKVLFIYFFPMFFLTPHICPE